MQPRCALHPAGGDEVGEAHRHSDQHGPLADRGDHIAQLVAQLLEQFVGDRLGPFEKGIVARVAGVIGILGRCHCRRGDGRARSRHFDQLRPQHLDRASLGRNDIVRCENARSKTGGGRVCGDRGARVA